MYATLDEVKRELGIPNATTDDDALIWSAIEAAQAHIDIYTGHTFEVSEATARTFDAVDDVDGRTLYIDSAASITTVVNGDGVTVESTSYTTEPRRETPYYAIKLLASSGLAWTYITDHEDAISVTAHWGYSTTPPHDVQRACVAYAAWMYRQRENRTGDQDRTIIAGNATILPSAMPSEISRLLKAYRRVYA